MSTLATLTPHLREDLLAFALYMRPQYVPAEFHRKLAKALERVASGECKRLIITMPPQHGKSEYCTRFFPAWLLGRDPSKRVIITGYNQELANGFSADCRAIVGDEKYSSVFPRTRINRDSQAVTHWRIDGHRGSVKAAGAGGPITGFGADCIIIDDPYKEMKEADSAIYQEDIWNWYRSVIYTRLAPGAAIIVVHTRWHEADLIGRLLEAQSTDPDADQWEVLHFAAEDDEGKYLWEEYYGAAHYKRAKANAGPRVWEALYQGRPRPIEGALFREDWFRSIHPQAPRLQRWVRAYDVAAAANKEADFYVGALVGIDDEGRFWIGDIQRWQAQWPESRKKIIRIANMDREIYGNVSIGIAKKMMGLPMLQDLMRTQDLCLPIYPIEEKGDKVQRAMLWQSRAEFGLLRLVEGPWINSFISECLSFPVGRHDDQVDAVSGAAEMLYKTRGANLEIYDPLQVAIDNNSWDYFEKLSQANAERNGYDSYEHEDFEDDWSFDSASGF